MSLFFHFQVCSFILVSITAADSNDFFDEIHSEGLPQFDWLRSDFESFDFESVPQKMKEREPSVEKEIVKRHYKQPAKQSLENKNEVYDYNPSSYYYPKNLNDYKTEDKHSDVKENIISEGKI